MDLTSNRTRSMVQKLGFSSLDSKDRFVNLLLYFDFISVFKVALTVLIL